MHRTSNDNENWRLAIFELLGPRCSTFPLQSPRFKTHNQLQNLPNQHENDKAPKDELIGKDEKVIKTCTTEGSSKLKRQEKPDKISAPIPKTAKESRRGREREK